MSTTRKKHQITFTFHASEDSENALLQSLTQVFKACDGVDLLSVDQNNLDLDPSRVTNNTQKPSLAINELLRIARRIHNDSILDGLERIHEHISLDSTLKEIHGLREVMEKNTLTNPPALMKRVHASNLSQSYIKALDKKLGAVEILGKKASVICDITRALSKPIPVDPEYHALHLSKKIVQTYLNGEKLLENPYILDGALMSAFQEFYTQFISIYIAEYSQYQDTINTLSKSYSSLGRTALAVEKLNQIPQLQVEDSDSVLSEWKTFLMEFPFHEYDTYEIEQTLKSQGLYRNFSLGMKPPKNDWNDLEVRINNLFKEQISRIQSASTRHILQSHNNSAIDRFRHLLQLTHLDDLAKLIENDSGDDICLSLHTLFLSPSHNS